MFTRVATLDELPPGALIEIAHEGDYYALCNVGGDIRALYGTCPHQGAPLGQGALEGQMISCPWHCWQFDSATGQCQFGDELALETYPVKIEGRNILVQLPSSVKPNA